MKVQFTGLTQNSQVDTAVCLKIPIRPLELTQILGQPCEFQVGGARLEDAAECAAVYSFVLARPGARGAGPRPAGIAQGESAIKCKYSCDRVYL